MISPTSSGILGQNATSRVVSYLVEVAFIVVWPQLRFTNASRRAETLGALGSLVDAGPLAHGAAGAANDRDIVGFYR